MIPDETVRVYWKTPDQEVHYKDEKDIARALRLRKGFIALGREYKIVIMKQKKWVTIAESKGWKNGLSLQKARGGNNERLRARIP